MQTEPSKKLSLETEVCGFTKRSEFVNGNTQRKAKDIRCVAHAIILEMSSFFNIYIYILWHFWAFILTGQHRHERGERGRMTCSKGLQDRTEPAYSASRTEPLYIGARSIYLFYFILFALACFKFGCCAFV